MERRAGSGSMARTALWTVLALTGFAANSLLCRAALAGGGVRIDPASFTAIRLGSGASMLWLLARLRGPHAWRGSWASALALFAYAAGFSLAYVRVPAGVGALVLFGCVQATMLGSGILHGERPRATEWIGLAVALAALVGLVAPGVSAPDPAGCALMAVAGVAWGVYSLRGRGSARPLETTADNFLRSVPLALALSGARFVIGPGLRGTTFGITCAVLSGALASGVGYSLWYAAVPRLSATRASIVQLAVPILAAVGGVLLLGEHLTLRLVIAGGALLAGISLALIRR